MGQHQPKGGAVISERFTVESIGQERLVAQTLFERGRRGISVEPSDP
jgi:hypothetical protein